ncbi:MAG TPA: DUF4162 domain-containing protein, partial [Candidatus Limnocylindrales bacterium]
LKRSSRARTLRLGVDGETLAPWLAQLPGVVAVRPGAGFAELELGAGAEPDAVLAAAVAHGASITRFEVAEPSLEAIFVDLVGRPAGDEATLAEGGPSDDAEPAAESMVEGAA